MNTSSSVRRACIGGCFLSGAVGLMMVLELLFDLSQPELLIRLLPQGCMLGGLMLLTFRIGAAARGRSAPRVLRLAPRVLLPIGLVTVIASAAVTAKQQYANHLNLFAEEPADPSNLYLYTKQLYQSLRFRQELALHVIGLLIVLCAYAVLPLLLAGWVIRAAGAPADRGGRFFGIAVGCLLTVGLLSAYMPVQILNLIDGASQCTAAEEGAFCGVLCMLCAWALAALNRALTGRAETSAASAPGAPAKSMA